jgi:Ca-activated chloride channel homolog
MPANTPQIEFFTEKARLAADKAQTVDVLLRITPPKTENQQAARPKLNLSLVLDRSGSMEGEKMKRAREAAIYCIEQLLPVDRISVVTFDDVVDVLIPSQRVENQQLLKRQINGIRARNSTALHEAWVKGGLQVSEHLEANAINRVLLITDGLANVGETNTDRIVTQAKQVYERGVSTSTIGIGADFNEDLLMPMAEAGGGNAWHVEEAADMQKIFAVELEGLLLQTAHTVTLGLVPADGVTIVDVLNDFETNENGRYKLPNLQSESPLEIVVRLKVPAESVGKTLRLLDVKLGYTPQNYTQAEVLKQFFEVEFDTEAVVEKLPENLEVQKNVQLLMNARARKEAIFLMDKGDFEGAQRGLKARYESTQVFANQMPASADIAQELEELKDFDSALFSTTDSAMSRKKLSYQAHHRQRGKK